MKKVIFLILAVSGVAFGVTCTNSVLHTSNPIAVHIDCSPVFVEDINIPEGIFPPDFISNEYARAQNFEINFATVTTLGQTIQPTIQRPVPIDIFGSQKDAFLNNFLLLRRYKEAVNYGLITSTATDITYRNLFAATTTQYAIIKDTVTALMQPAP